MAVSVALFTGVAVWLALKFGKYVENGPPGTWRAAFASFVRKYPRITSFALVAMCLFNFREDIGPFFYKLVWAKAYRADYVELRSAVETHRPRAVAAIYYGTRTCVKRNARAVLPDFVGQMLSEYTLLTFDGWFVGEDTHRLWKTRLLPKYHEYGSQIAGLTRQQRKALNHLMDGTADSNNNHYHCVARNAIKWLDARKPDNRGKA